MYVWSIRQTPRTLQKQPEETGVQLPLPAMTYVAETWTLTKHNVQFNDNLAATQSNMERSMLNIIYKDRKTNIWVRKRTKVIDIISNVRKMKWSWATVSKTTDGPHVTPLEDHKTRKGDKGDQPSGGETTWANTGGTRSGRGQPPSGDDE